MSPQRRRMGAAGLDGRAWCITRGSQCIKRLGLLCRITNFLRGRSASQRVLTGRPLPHNMSRTRSQSVAAAAAAAAAAGTAAGSCSSAPPRLSVTGTPAVASRKPVQAEQSAPAPPNGSRAKVDTRLNHAFPLLPTDIAFHNTDKGLPLLDLWGEYTTARMLHPACKTWDFDGPCMWQAPGRAEGRGAHAGA